MDNNYKIRVMETKTVAESVMTPDGYEDVSIKMEYLSRTHVLYPGDYAIMVAVSAKESHATTHITLKSGYDELDAMELYAYTEGQVRENMVLYTPNDSHTVKFDYSTFNYIQTLHNVVAKHVYDIIIK